MKESSTYQAILEEGRAEGDARGIRMVVVRHGTRRFGAPDAAAQTALEAITDVPRLLELTDRVQTATDWNDLLGIPSEPTRRRGQRSGS
jgi:hypothetical protein